MLLILITTACRISVILRLSSSPDRILDRGEHVLYPTGLDKNATVNKHAQELYLWDSEDCLSPYRALKSLLCYKKGEGSLIFRSASPNKTLNVNELRRWASSIMTISGVPNVFRTHSIRGASVSKASTQLDTADIMLAANWRSENTLKKFYLRNSGHLTLQQKSLQMQKCVLKV